MVSFCLWGFQWHGYQPETLKEIARSLTTMHCTKVKARALFLRNIIMELYLYPQLLGQQT